MEFEFDVQEGEVVTVVTSWHNPETEWISYGGGSAGYMVLHEAECELVYQRHQGNFASYFAEHMHPKQIVRQKNKWEWVDSDNMPVPAGTYLLYAYYYFATGPGGVKYGMWVSEPAIVVKQW